MMAWLHESSFYWTLVGSLANIGFMAVVFAVLAHLWFNKHVHAWGATITFAIYVVLFAKAPTPMVQAWISGEPVQPQDALRTVFFFLSVTLLLRKTLKTKPD